MKYIICLLFISNFAFANAQLEQRIQALEARVKMLESKLGQSVDSSSGLKVRDMGNNQMKNNIGSRATAGSAPQITDEQQKEIMNTIEHYKKRQAESQKLLDELMNEP